MQMILFIVMFLTEKHFSVSYQILHILISYYPPSFYMTINTSTNLLMSYFSLRFHEMLLLKDSYMK